MTEHHLTCPEHDGMTGVARKEERLLAIGVHQGLVVIDFGTVVSVVDMLPEEARDLAGILMEKARQAEEMTGSERKLE